MRCGVLTLALAKVPLLLRPRSENPALTPPYPTLPPSLLLHPPRSCVYSQKSLAQFAKEMGGFLGHTTLFIADMGHVLSRSSSSYPRSYSTGVHLSIWVSYPAGSRCPSTTFLGIMDLEASGAWLLTTLHIHVSMFSASGLSNKSSTFRLYGFVLYHTDNKD